jgi:hypothetical protein
VAATARARRRIRARAKLGEVIRKLHQRSARGAMHAHRIEDWRKRTHRARIRSRMLQRRGANFFRVAHDASAKPRALPERARTVFAPPAKPHEYKVCGR